MSNLFFTSAQNYMKRDPSSGSTNMAAPTTSAYSGSLFVSNFTVTHNLGYTPSYRVYYEPFKGGVIWPPMATRNAASAINPLNTGGATGPGIIATPTTTQLNIQLFYTNNTLTGTYPVYWVIYADYNI